jgi:glycine cleavage system pyridoxal-binding protein P
MLAAIGVPSVDALFRDVPAAARLDKPIAGLTLTMGELEVERHMAALAARSRPAGCMASFIGAGAYRHHVPASVDHLIQRGEFLTSYTPYQPEVSQGTLQYLFEFQTQVAMITGMEVANASMYDGATATVEAVVMANRVTRRGKAVLSGGLHPHYRAVVETQARFGGFTAVAAAPQPVAAGTARTVWALARFVGPFAPAYELLEAASVLPGLAPEERAPLLISTASAARENGNKATEVTTGRSLSIVTCTTLLSAALPAGSVTRARKR